MTNQTLPLDQIRTDGGTQTRAALDQTRVDEYAERMLEGDVFPPVDVWFDGTFHWLSGGFHRLAARKQAQFDEILATIHQGSLRDARLHGAGQNAAHGLPRTNEEKRRAVMMLLEDPEWSSWGDNVIARYCHVSQPFVSKLRKSSTNNVISKRMYTRNGKTALMDTSAIRERKSSASPPPAATHPDNLPTIWKVEQHIHSWVENQRFPPDVVWKITLPEIAKWKSNSHYWRSLTETIPQPWRVNDVVQGLHNVKEQLRQKYEQENVPVLIDPADELPHMAGNVVTIDNGECDKDEWYTPAWLIEMVREIMPIVDLDPASSDEAQTVVQAKQYWTKQNNSLAMNWIARHNIRGPQWEASGVWLNPPYSHPLVEQFVDKLLEQIEKGCVYSAFLLVNNNTETAWWHKAAARATSVCFFQSRISFWRPGQGEVTSPRQGQNLFYFGPLVGKFADTFSPKGIVYRNKLYP